MRATLVVVPYKGEQVLWEEARRYGDKGWARVVVGPQGERPLPLGWDGSKAAFKVEIGQGVVDVQWRRGSVLVWAMRIQSIEPPLVEVEIEWRAVGEEESVVKQVPQEWREAVLRAIQMAKGEEG